MATGAHRQPDSAGTAEQRSGMEALPLAEAGEASGEVDRYGEREGRALPPVIEVSDKDYRSFCFPCHALEEGGEGDGAV